jgi:hypothetical protein
MSARSIIRVGAAVAAGMLALSSLGAVSAAPARTAVPVTIAGRTQLAVVVSPLVLQDVGTVTGSPVGSGNITLRYRLLPKRGTAITTFIIVNAHGTVRGKAVSQYTMNNVSITFTGAARLSGGTGRYAGITSGTLEFNALHSITGKKEAISFVGRGTKPA